MDIFKAIFASDEEDEGEGEEGADNDGADETGRDAAAHGQANGDTAAPPANSVVAIPDAGPSRAAPVDYNNMAGKVDISDFKPTFVSRSDRTKDKEKEKRDKAKVRDKEKKKKRHKTTLVSFEVDEEGGGGHERPGERDEKKRKKKKSEKVGARLPVVDEEDEGLWVEKPPPETVKDFTTLPSAPLPSTADEEPLESGPPRGRKRAIDFM